MTNRILVPLDGSTLAEASLPHAVALAKVFDASLTCLQVVERSEPQPDRRAVDPLEWQMRRTEAEAYVQGVAERFADLGIPAESRILDGSPAKSIIEFAHNNGQDLIVVSSHGRSGLSEWGISSVVQKVVLRAMVPVYIVRAYSEEEQALDQLTYRQILVPLDGSPRAECALSVAETVASAHNAKLLLVHVVERPEVPRRAPLTDREQGLVDEIVRINQDRAQQYMSQVKTRSRDGAEVMVRVADSAAVALHRLIEERNVDLMVLSAHGYSGEPRWPYGSVALNLIFYGSSAMLIVQDIPLEDLEPTEAELASREKKGH